MKHTFYEEWFLHLQSYAMSLLLPLALIQINLAMQIFPLIYILTNSPWEPGSMKFYDKDAVLFIFRSQFQE